MGNELTIPQGIQAVFWVVEQHIVVVPSQGDLDNTLPTIKVPPQRTWFMEKEMYIERTPETRLGRKKCNFYLTIEKRKRGSSVLYTMILSYHETKPTLGFRGWNFLWAQYNMIESSYLERNKKKTLWSSKSIQGLKHFLIINKITRFSSHDHKI